MGETEITIAPLAIEALIAERTASLQNFGKLPLAAQTAVSASLLTIAKKAMEMKKEIKTAGWGKAFTESGAEDLMLAERKKLQTQFGETANTRSLGQIIGVKNIEPIVRAAAANLSLAELESLERRGKKIKSGQIREGRTYHTNESQRGPTQSTTLHRGNPKK